MRNLKKKMISMPEEWDDKIKKVHPGTISSYIVSAIMDKMKADGIDVFNESTEVKKG